MESPAGVFTLIILKVQILIVTLVVVRGGCNLKVGVFTLYPSVMIVVVTFYESDECGLVDSDSDSNSRIGLESGLRQ